jgi:hypothetical protein
LVERPARRDVELKAQRNRAGSGRRSRTTARSLVEELWLHLPKTDYRAFPEDFIATGTETEVISLNGEVTVGTHLMTHGPLVARGSVRIGDSVIDLGSDARAALLGRAARTHEGQKVPVPIDSDYCQRLLEEHDAYIETHRAELQQRAAQSQSRKVCSGQSSRI